MRRLPPTGRIQSASRAATPVVGNLLLVAVVLVLGVIITVTAVGLLGATDAEAPVAQFSPVQSDTGVGIVHQVGDVIESSNLYLRFDGNEVPATTFTNKSTIGSGTVLTVQPRGADRIDIVWKEGDRSALIETIDSYQSTAVFEFTGEAQSLDVSETASVEIELLGAGGEPGAYTNTSAGITAGGATAGGFITMTLDVSDTDQLDIYVGGSPESTAANPAGGWGWLDGGAPDSGSGFVGGGGGGATAMLGDGTVFAVAHGGGGGADWDTYTFYPGGGGGGGGRGGTAWYAPPPKAENGDGTGLGGDGAGQADGGGGDESSFIPGTPGQAELLQPSLATEVKRDTRPGAGPGTDGLVRVTYTIAE